jgi:ferredoxin
MAANIEINRDECTSCKTCVDACFVDVLRWDEAEAKPMVACELNCPAQCINVVPDMPGQPVNPY